MAELARVHVLIQGRVQGVFFVNHPAVIHAQDPLVGSEGLGGEDPLAGDG